MLPASGVTHSGYRLIFGLFLLFSCPIPARQLQYRPEVSQTEAKKKRSRDHISIFFHTIWNDPGSKIIGKL